jgi:hypothetical protein
MFQKKNEKNKRTLLCAQINKEKENLAKFKNFFFVFFVFPSADYVIIINKFT